jgi:hypothetical protein
VLHYCSGAAKAMKTISMDLKLSIRFGASGLEDQARSLLHVDHSGKKDPTDATPTP